MSQSNDFVSKSSYLLGFLAALIGLAAFKDNLASAIINIPLLSIHFDLLSAAVPMLIIMLLAAYLSALAQFSGNVTFTKVPLSKILNIASNATAIIALLYPLVFGLLIVLANLMALIINSPGLKGFSIVSVIALLLSFLSISFVSAVKINQNKQEDELAKTLSHLNDVIVSYSKYSSDQSGILTPHDFLKQYEELVETIVKYIKLRGYGVGGRGLFQLAKILQSKNIFNSIDVDMARLLNKNRNSYAHGKEDLTYEELHESVMKITDLRNKVIDALYRLNPEEEEK